MQPMGLNGHNQLKMIVVSLIEINLLYIYQNANSYLCCFHNTYINVDLLPPVVAMHACIVLGLCEHNTPTACDVESRR
jgi:hypothetical protein